MYTFPYHREKNPEVIRAFIDQNPFAFLSGCNADQQPVATQVPVFIEERAGKQLLRGHIMRNTDHYRAFEQNPNVLVVVTGRSTYVSGTWYSNPNTPSTWNFMSVHLRGKIRFLDEEGLREIMRMTTLHFEGGNTESETVFDNLPADMQRRLLPIIAGFEIEITEMDNCFKLSQDRDYESYQNIMAKLKEQGGDGAVIAEEMEKRVEEVFPGK